MKPHIFVEGSSDYKFIKDIIKFKFDIEILEMDITKTNGDGGIKTSGNNLRENNIDGRTNLIIFDADKGIKEKSEEIEKLLEVYKVRYELFLFPNNKYKGCLEDILLQIVNPKHDQIFKCFDGYGDCLESGRIKYYKPNKKSKVHAYLDALHENTSKEKKKIRFSYRDYLNADHWDLNHECLLPLYDFLKLYF